MTENATNKFMFNPIDRSAQELMCKVVNLPLIYEPKYGFVKNLHLPARVHHINSDGNCLFRALAYAITGRQVYHHFIRHKILEHMKEIESLLVPHMNMCLNLYLLNSNMSSEGAWGSDIEILAASSLLNTDIYVYTKVGNSFKWQKFSRSMLDSTLPSNTSSIYLQHTNGVHYDVVLDVCLFKHEKATANNSPSIKNKRINSFTNNECPASNSTEAKKQKLSKCKNDVWIKRSSSNDCEISCSQQNFNQYFAFFPVNKPGQEFMSSVVKLPLICYVPYGSKKLDCLTMPCNIRHIQGDGNCLFRALSYVVTGVENYHSVIRHKLVNHMKEIEALLLPHMNVPLNLYLLNSNMLSEGVWGSDIEIFAASSLLSTDIYVYTRVGNSFRWQKFSRSMLDSTLPSNKSSIYLQHTNGVHYDVVLDVNAEMSETTFPTKVEMAGEKKEIDGNTTVINKGHLNKSNTKMHKKFNQSHVCGTNREERNYISSSSKIQYCENNESHASFDHNEKMFFSESKNKDMFHKSIQYVIKQCIVCNEAWPCKSNLNCQLDYTCARCTRDKKVPKKFSIENLMIPSAVPTELQNLTQIEEMLISRALPIMKIFVNAGGQRGYSGHCINLPQKVEELATSLPRCPKDIPIVVVTMKGNNSGSFKDVTVRKQKVENALCWLVQHNPLYYNISIDKSAIAQLPFDGVPSQLTQLEARANDINSLCNKSLNGDLDEGLFDYTKSSSFLPVNINDHLENDAIKKTLKSAKISWPTIENEPLNEYTTPFLATMAYPSLFPDAKGDPTNPGLLYEIPFLSKVQHLIKFAEKIDNKWVYRFASHPRFCYWALNMIQRKRTLQQSAIFLQQNPGEAHMTIDQLRDMAFSKNSSSFMLKLSRYVANIAGSPSYWFKIREDLKAIISHKEPPTIFFTFSAADLYWPELHSLFESNHKHQDFSPEQKRENVINNPHIVDWYFTKRIENFIKYWLYDTLNAEWHWYRFEFQARGSIHCHGMAKLKSDPGLCKLTELALKGHLSEICQKNGTGKSVLSDVEVGKQASQKVCDYVDCLLSTWNPQPPQNGDWIKPNVHPCSRRHSDIPVNELETDYIDLLNTVQRHTRCSTKYCLRHAKGSNDLQCRFDFPFDFCEKTKLIFEKIHTKDNCARYKAKVVTRRNDPRLNSHQKIQLQGWRANCDIQVVIDHHACVEYLAKYAAKGESRSSVLDDAFDVAINNQNSDTNLVKTVKKIMIKTLGQRDFGAQETMHLLLSLKLYSSTFTVIPVNLNNSRRVETKTAKRQNCTKNSLLDAYAKRTELKESYPDIVNMNLIDFVKKFRVVNGKLQNQKKNIVPRVFPSYSPNPQSQNYGLYCKYQLLKYKPWKLSLNNVWASENPQDNTYISAWNKFLNSLYAKQHVPNYEEILHSALSAALPTEEDCSPYEKPTQEEWMILANLHNGGIGGNSQSPEQTSHDWSDNRANYSQQMIAEMPKWIETKKDYSTLSSARYIPVDTSSFSEKQGLAYNIILKHSSEKSEDPLLLIITGEAGTGKSYLINAVRNCLKKKCVVTATTGKAAYNIGGITIHSLLHLPIAPSSHKDLSGRTLSTLQTNLAGVEYILIDEYSMLGQKTLGWIDRRCRQITGLKEKVLGGKSFIFLGDPGQLPPVGDKPLYHAKPTSDICKQGYLIYLMFNNVVTLTVNQRVGGLDCEKATFRNLLARLRNGRTTIPDWHKLLARQPTSVKDINNFKDATKLFYSNKQVAKYNYEQLTQLKQPIALINARHSNNNVKHVSPQQMFGLQPSLLICKSAKVMLTMNLWPSVGLCNGSTGQVIDIIYAENHRPPDLPIAVIVKFDDYVGPSFSNMKDCVPITPVTASVHIDNSVAERQQLPLTLAWAITIHKSQGLTLEKAWIDIGEKESTLGMSYVAVSRVRNLSSLVVEPISFERLSNIGKSETLQYRLKEENRLRLIAERTCKLNTSITPNL